LLDLKLLDRALRDVLGGGTDGFIADVEAVHFDASGATEAPAEGDGRKTVLGGVEVAAVLDLHSGFKLCQIEEIPSIDGQVLDLLAGQNALHGDLLGVDLDSRSLHFHHLIGLPPPAASRYPQW